ncbi:MAG: CRISPR system precrRNA processing endoribonuclease RAMP protein Cas6 [Gammaproteobacteria bacterium]
MLAQIEYPRLSLARYQFNFSADSAFRLPDYAGSAWRGAFGRALKRLVCVTREPVCANCLLYRSCSYPYIFETPPDPGLGVMTQASAAPHPYVLTPAPGRGERAAGATVTLGLTLLGHSLRQLPYIVHALAQAGQHGLTAARAPLTLRTVWQQDEAGDWQLIYCPDTGLQSRLQPLPAITPSVPPCPPRLTLTLITPLRIKRGGHFATPDRFDFATLFSGLLRRISLLMQFHGEAALSTDFAALSQQARAIPLRRTELYWREYTRYSSRQKTSMQLGGVVGQIELDGHDLAPFWPYLWLGQWTHAGKMTSMGLGRYSILADKLASPAALSTELDNAMRYPQQQL